MKNILIILLLVVICGLSAFIGYTSYSPINPSEVAESDDVIINQLPIQNEFEEVNSVVKSSSNAIGKYTKMVYEYVYLQDGITEIIEDVPPYFLLNLTKEDLEKNFSDWQVTSFSDTEVVMQKTIDGESMQHYEIKEYEGFVAVFYNNVEEGEILKDITDIPLESLSSYERSRVENGIEIVGKDELIGFLENYGS